MSSARFVLLVGALLWWANALAADPEPVPQGKAGKIVGLTPARETADPKERLPRGILARELARQAVLIEVDTHWR